MKRILLIIFSVIVFAPGKTQPWAATGATWHYEFDDYVFCPPWYPYGIGYVKISKTVDTVIAGKNCDVLLKERWLHGCWGGGNLYVNLGYEYTYLDSGKVYRYINGHFTVLYDFNKNAGEYWLIEGDSTMCPNPFSRDTVWVQNTGTVIINSDTLKQLTLYWNFQSPPNWMFLYSPMIAEKIGPLGYMFPETNCIADYWEGGLLRCYTDSSGWSYQTNIAPYCEYYPSGVNEFHDQFSLSPSPNPTSGKFQITNAKHQISKVEITDVLGREVKSLKVAKSKVEIDLTGEPLGLYFVRVWDEKGNTSIKKLVLQ
jgi:hypothetical protein